jgi:hypothetical protein
MNNTYADFEAESLSELIEDILSFYSERGVHVKVLKAVENCFDGNVRDWTGRIGIGQGEPIHHCTLTLQGGGETATVTPERIGPGSLDLIKAYGPGPHIPKMLRGSGAGMWSVQIHAKEWR